MDPSALVFCVAPWGQVSQKPPQRILLQCVSPPLHSGWTDVLSKGSSTGLFASPNSSCGLRRDELSNAIKPLAISCYGLFTNILGPCSSVWWEEICLQAACLCKLLGWHWCSVAWHLPFTWHLRLGVLWAKAGMHSEPSITACTNQVPGPSQPCTPDQQETEGFREC